MQAFILLPLTANINNITGDKHCVKNNAVHSTESFTVLEIKVSILQKGQPDHQQTS